MVIGVILAAGKSSRMGRLKQLIEIEDQGQRKPMVAAAFDSICSVCSQMVVVLGAGGDRVLAALHPRMFSAARSDPEAEMMDSIRVGLGKAVSLAHDCSVLLQLADHPRVTLQTVRQLLDSGSRHPGQAVIPRFQSRGGHPILIPSAIIDKLITAPPVGGLRRFWQRHKSFCHWVDVDDATVVMDVDTPDDLRTLGTHVRRT